MLTFDVSWAIIVVICARVSRVVEGSDKEASVTCVPSTGGGADGEGSLPSVVKGPITYQRFMSLNYEVYVRSMYTTDTDIVIFQFS